MNAGKRMATLFRSVYTGDERGEAWHGPALKTLLKDVTPQQASMNPKSGSHSILQLVQHIAYWEEIVLRRFRGEIVNAPLNSPDDWPPNHKVSEAEWQAALERLERSHIALLRAIEGCADETLGKKVPERNYDNYILLHGIIDHCVYHTGQIALLKKSVVI